MDIHEFFSRHHKAAVALSGGVDSAYVLAAAVREGADVHSYFVDTPFQPRSELADARRAALEAGAPLTVVELDVLADEAVAANGSDRCYLCKRAIFSAIVRAAGSDGYKYVLDGTNATDDADDRPGMRALGELGVASPLRLCGIGKAQVRNAAREMGLSAWEKPSYACLATRVPCGTRIERDMLETTEAAERSLAARGFADFRVRWAAGAALIQIPADQMQKAIEERDAILSDLGGHYSAVTLDLRARETEGDAK